MSTAASVPSCDTAVNAAPGSWPKNTPDTIRRCADDEIGRNSVRPWTSPRTTTSIQLTSRSSRVGRSARRKTSRRRTVPPGRAATFREGAASPGWRAARTTRRRPLRLRDVQRRRVGSSGLQVSRIGLGTMTWGDNTDGDAAAEQLRVFVQSGGTLVETADGYGGGIAQDVLAGLLRRAVSRDDLVIAG